MLEDKLYALFGFQTFKAGQKEIIERLLLNEDVMAMLPTGRGKSLCYQLPAFLSEGLTIVVSPLLSLMEDQVQQLKSQGLKQVASLNGFTPIAERRKLINDLSFYKLLYTSPEMLQSDDLIHELQCIKISYLVVDEAHCVSYWGHDFRADYLRIKKIRNMLNNPPCLAITATATPEVRKDIVKELELRNPFSFIESVNRPNIYLLAEEMQTQTEKLNRLKELIRDYQSPALVYVQTRAQAEFYSTQLALSNKTIKVSYYHGGMENMDRMLIQQQYMQGQLDVICATNAFGMGLNKDNVRFVIHLHYPLDLASYLQEIGRAGRDGDPSFAVLLTTPEDKHHAVHLIERGEVGEEDWLLALTSLQDGQSANKEAFEDELEKMGIDNARAVTYMLEKWGILRGKTVQSFDGRPLAKRLHRHFEANIQARKNRLTAVAEYVMQTTVCRRAHVLRYFDEVPIQQKPCCDVCGMSLDLFAKESHSKNMEVFFWEEELKIIFGVEEGKKNEH